jgi:tRNA(fMet)-specific endonuclease VapC
VKRYSLDSNIWIYLMKNQHPEVRYRFERMVPGSVVMCPVVLGELYVGWRNSAHTDKNRRLLDEFTRDAVLEPVSADTALRYAETRVDLYRVGKPIGPNDLWIAAHALAHDCILVTHNVGEFERVPGLQVEDWVQG